MGFTHAAAQQPGVPEPPGNPPPPPPPEQPPVREPPQPIPPPIDDPPPPVQAAANLDDWEALAGNRHRMTRKRRSTSNVNEGVANA